MLADDSPEIPSFIFSEKIRMLSAMILLKVKDLMKFSPIFPMFSWR